MNEYDRRQLTTMHQQLEAYDVGHADLSTLISNLEALQNLLETMPASWRASFREQWGILEQVYSVAVVREQPIESTENKALISPALVRMRTMIDEALGA
jgi:hypothetical protein